MTQSTKSSPSSLFPYSLKTALTWNLKKDVGYLMLLSICLFYYLSLLSFSPNDTGFYSTHFPPKHVQNFSGILGSLISSFSFLCFGFMSFLLPIPLIRFIHAKIYGQDNIWNKKSTMLAWYILLLGITIILSLNLKPWFVDGIAFNVGGAFGEWISKTSAVWLGKIGTHIIASLCCLAALVQVDAIHSLNFFVPRNLNLLTTPLDWLKKHAHKTSLKEKTKKNEIQTAPPVYSEPERFIQDEPNIEILSTKDASIVEIKKILPYQHSERKVYVPPHIDVLKQGSQEKSTPKISDKEHQKTADLLTKTFLDFGISGIVTDHHPGPVVTVFEFEPDAGTKLSKIVSLVDDLALALKVDSIFIYPVRGKRAVGVQVPNRDREMVYLGDVIASPTFKESSSPLTFAMGKDLSGNPVCADLTTMPHLLTAGATGSGKSVAINTLLSSIIMKASPEDVRMILVDPKMLELSVYEGIPHLLMPVITEPSRSSLALKWAVQEMERRYKIMQSAAVRNISGFNQWWAKASSKQRSELMQQCQEKHLEAFPYILLVIDELADLMMMAPKDVEQSIQRLAQKARASGIHLVLATQRPSVDIITGVIKANLPCRIAFQVVSKHDSRTILDQVGAEKLLGKGDMLYMRPGASRIDRIQGAFVSDEEVLALVAAAKKKSEPQYDENVIAWIEEELASQNHNEERLNLDLENLDDDPKWNEAIQIARSQGFISASYLQRQLKIGYNRAARMVESMEAKNLVSKADGSKPRKWIEALG